MGPKAGPMGSRTPPTSDLERRPGHRPVAEGEDSGLSVPSMYFLIRFSMSIVMKLASGGWAKEAPR